MFRRILKGLLVSVGALVMLGAVLFFFGLRIVLDGGGGIHLRFVESAEAHARDVERHRQGQRAQAAPEASGAQAAIQAPAVVAPTIVAPGAAPAVAPAAGPAPYWTDFRGPNRDGHYRERPILTTWPAAGLSPVWKQPVGEGYASFVVARGRAFTIEQRGPKEVVAAYDVTTGLELWSSDWAARFSEMLGGDGPRATPTWSDGRVYALGAAGELRCLDDGTGKVLWRVNILEDNGASNLEWGMAASPLVVNDTVIVLPGGPNGRSVVAYDRRTGARVWSALDDHAAYSSPMLVTLAGVRQLLVLSASRLMGLTPDRGQVLWSYPWTTQYDINAAQPLVVSGTRVFISSGYGAGAAVIEVAPNAPAWTVREVWRNTRMKNQFTSSVLEAGFIYGLDESILACVDAATGDLKWKGGRYGYGQVLLASGHLLVLTEDGDLALVRATSERHDELVRFHALDGKTWNHPAMADGYLLIRNLNQMAAFDLRMPGR
jgi:outer membrane protein assembly factor BamB